MLMAVPSGDRVRVSTMLAGDEPSAPTAAVTTTVAHGSAPVDTNAAS